MLWWNTTKLMWTVGPCARVRRNLKATVTYATVTAYMKSCQCALTYLLFHEGHEFMTDNVDYYREVLGYDGSPREVRNLLCYSTCEGLVWRLKERLQQLVS
ncbi:hypothetical protein GOODEAATRI_008626 [Goodea atripinnis]|uniref:Uncharacterized protein n=1 Tax=Goodea atripinnis TaxID=208336 RepID=A0ABV0PMJ5_9TELE